MNLAVPKWLDWSCLKYKLSRCLRLECSKDYYEFIQLAYDNFSEDMDIVRIIRRHRLASFCLSYLLDNNKRHVACQLAAKMSLRVRERSLSPNEL